MMRSTAFLAALISLILMVSPPAHAAGRAAIVLEASGVEDAKITAPSEIRATATTGATIALGKGGRITFVHYISCNKVTAIGGSVTVFADHYTSSGSQLSEVKQPCPELIPLQTAAASARAGALFAHEIVPPSSISLHLMIVMISKSGPIFTDLSFQLLTREQNAINLTPTGRPVLTKVINGFVQMPDAGLSPGQYRLTWNSPNGSPTQITASADDVPGGQSLLIIVLSD